LRVNMVNKVKGFIIAKPELANSDVDLIWAIWAWQLAALKPPQKITSMSAKDLCRTWKEGTISSPFNISRSRRKCQQHYPETRGDEYVKKQHHQRRIKQDVKRETDKAAKVLSERSSDSSQQSPQVL